MASAEGCLFTRPAEKGVLIGEFGLLPRLLTLTLSSLPPVLLPFFFSPEPYPRFARAMDRHSRRLSGFAILAVFLAFIYVLVGQLGARVLVGLLEKDFFGRG